MIKLSSMQICKILNVSQQVNATEITEISTDSRKVDDKTLFIALKGEKFDGHDFILDVLNKGCPLVLSERKIEGTDEKKVIVVDDTLKAFGKLAQYNRRQYKGTVIALTGSSGKTTTKEELKAALSQYAPTYATSGNFNNFIGVPRSLLDIDMNAKYAIIEMGMSAPGEIDYLVHLTEPDVALVTNVYPMHIEFLKTTENIAKAKAEIFGGLKKGGIALYNEDTLHADILKKAAYDATDKVFTFGKKHHVSAELHLTEEGEHLYYNAWAVLAVISALGLDVAPAVEAINHFTAPEGRGKRYNVSLGERKITLIDNSYSGGPDATVLAVESLGKMNVAGRKIAVIGKMAELGDYTREAHVRVGKALAQNHVDVVIGVCEETKDVLAQLPTSVEQHYFKSIDGVSAFLQDKVLQNGDAVLIKGSHYSSQVYKAAAELKNYAR